MKCKYLQAHPAGVLGTCFLCTNTKSEFCFDAMWEESCGKCQHFEPRQGSEAEKDSGSTGKKLNKRNESFDKMIDEIYGYRDRKHEDFCSCGATILEGEIKGLDFALGKIKNFCFKESGLAELEECQAEIRRLEKQVEQRQSAIEQIDSILAELFGIAHNGYEYSDEFKELLKQKTKCCVSMRQDPVDIASDLIKVFCWQGEEYLPLEIGELRQIAEHLLVYCDANCGEKIR